MEELRADTESATQYKLFVFETLTKVSSAVTVTEISEMPDSWTFFIELNSSNYRLHSINLTTNLNNQIESGSRSSVYLTYANSFT